MKNAYLALVLNAHMPFVRRPEYPRFLEERWLFEVISETYLPAPAGLPLPRGGLGAFPPHAERLAHPRRHARRQGPRRSLRGISRVPAQARRSRGGSSRRRPGLRPARSDVSRAVLAPTRTTSTSSTAETSSAAMDFYYKKGRVELMTSGATHAFLPIFRDCREAVTSQVETAIISHRKAFGKHPAGFWLPQLGWYPGVAELLRSYNVQYTVVTTKGAMLGEPTPRYGSFAPVECPSGLVAFIRDAGATKAVWSESSGYPADPAYRDFYRDIGFDLPADYLDAHLENPGERIFTGFKYWAVTGGPRKSGPTIRSRRPPRPPLTPRTSSPSGGPPRPPRPPSWTGLR